MLRQLGLPRGRLLQLPHLLVLRERMLVQRGWNVFGSSAAATTKPTAAASVAAASAVSQPVAASVVAQTAAASAVA